MAVNAPAFVQVHPNFFEPGLILPYAQASGAFDTIEGGEPRVRLAEDDLYVYMSRVDLRTSEAGGQSAYNQLPGVNIAFSQLSTPSYLLRNRAEYDHHDTAAAARWNASLPELYRRGLRQSHFQQARSLLLYGANPQNGEGLLNCAGATATNLPADSNGNTTVRTYDNGEMAFYLLTLVLNMKTRTNQLGIGRKFTILGPQRILGLFEYPDVVQLVQFQRTGAGSETTKGLFQEILSRNKDMLTWSYDDTLIGKGDGGKDAVIITMPEVESQNMDGIDTNEFAKVQPGNDACVTMYADMAAPKEITSPLPGGAVDLLLEWRLTSGWGVRPEAITIVSMEY